MNKNQIKIKNKMILNIRKSIEAQFSIIDTEKEKFVSMINIKTSGIYNKINDIEKVLNNEELDEEKVLMIINELASIEKMVDSFIDLKKLVIQDIYNKISENNGYRKAMENYVTFFYTTTQNNKLLKLEYEKIQRQICELIMDSFKNITDEILSILDLRGFYYKLFIDICIEHGKRRIEKLEESKDVKSEISKDEIQKIYSYKEMNKFAEENGFNAVRQTGSHLMYIKNNITIPIPQHSIGKGLSIVIQKQILKVS